MTDPNEHAHVNRAAIGPKGRVVPTESPETFSTSEDAFYSPDLENGGTFFQALAFAESRQGGTGKADRFANALVDVTIHGNMRTIAFLRQRVTHLDNQERLANCKIAAHSQRIAEQERTLGELQGARFLREICFALSTSVSAFFAHL